MVQPTYECVDPNDPPIVEKFHFEKRGGVSKVVFGHDSDGQPFPIKYRLSKSTNSNGQEMSIQNIYLGDQNVSATNHKWQLHTAKHQNLIIPLYDIFTGNSLMETKKDEVYLKYGSIPNLNSDLGSSFGNLLFEMENANDNILADFTIEAYFSKDEMHPVGNTPNWFFYWSQIPLIQDLLTIDGIHFFNPSDCSFDLEDTEIELELVYSGGEFDNRPPNIPVASNSVYASTGVLNVCPTNSDIHKKLELDGAYCHGEGVQGATGYIDNKIKIFKGCGYRKEIDPCREHSTEPTITKGIHTFLSSILHERQHIQNKVDVWTYTHPEESTVGPGFLNIYDRDRDGYKDIWEQRSMKAKDYGFKYDENSPSDADKYQNGFLGSQCNLCEEEGSPDYCSAGTRYEELECIKVENTYDLDLVNDFDWSFDGVDWPSEVSRCQGKNW